jgi:hypothetical protein
MARGFGMTALRAALGGVAGYGQDVAARREREKLDAEMARQQERQAAMDRIALRREGYMTPEEAGAERGAGGAALSRALASASGMLAGRPGPAFGQALGASDGSAIVRGMSQVGPQQRETIGGQAFVRESPVAAALRTQEMAANRERMGEERKQAQERTEKQGEFERNVQSAMSAYGMKRPQAEEYVRTGKSPFLPMSQQERDASARGWAGINLRRREQPGAGGDNIEKIKRLPVRAQTKLEGIDAGLMMADNLRQMLESNPEAVGLKGVFPNVILSRTDPQGVAVRSAIENLSGEIRNQRFGGALTKNEAEFSLQNLPDRRDTAASAMAKLNELVKFLEIKRKAQYNTYGLDYTPTERETTGSATGAGRTASPEPRRPGETIQQYKARTGG